MGLKNVTTLTCDKDLVNTASMESPDSPLPDGWMKVQGYANNASGESDSIVGYFCPICIQQYGTKDLVKTATEISISDAQVPKADQQASEVTPIQAIK